MTTFVVSDKIMQTKIVEVEYLPEPKLVVLYIRPIFNDRRDQYGLGERA